MSSTDAQIRMATFGPWVIGNFISCMLLGMHFIFAWYYLYSRRKDHWAVKAVVIILTLFTTVDTATGCLREMRLSVLEGAQQSAYLRIRGAPEAVIQPLFANLTASLSQSFLAYRALSFGWAMRAMYGAKARAAYWISGPILILGVISSWGIGITIPAYYSGFERYDQFINMQGQYFGTFALLVDFQLGLFVAVDILLMIFLTYEFRSARTGFAASNVVIDTIITITIRNAVLITACQIIQLVLGKTGFTGWSTMSMCYIGKLYAMTVLSILVGPKQKQAQWQAKQDLENARHHHPSSHPSEYSGPIGGTGWTASNYAYASGMTSNASGSTSRCRSCGSTAVSSTPLLDCGPSHALGVDYKNRGMDDGIMGFRAALLDLEELSDHDRHSVGAEKGQAEGEKDGNLAHQPTLQDLHVTPELGYKSTL